MQTAAVRTQQVGMTLYPVLFAISLVHLFNDTIQAVIPASYPVLMQSMHLTYTQIGFIGFAINFTASMMQPVVGLYSDVRPTPAMLPLGMVSTFLGMLGLAFAPSYPIVLLAVVLVGIGSAVFHPEAARVSNLAAGRRRGLAQSIYQVGGNAGQSLAPVMTALIFVPLGQRGAVWFTLVAGAAIVVQTFIAKWYRGYLDVLKAMPRKPARPRSVPGRSASIAAAMVLLVLFVFARSWYHAAITSYYPFYLVHNYGLSISSAQIYIFLFLAAGAVGTFLGGPIADRFGRRNVIVFSMLGSAPLAILLPYVGHLAALAICLVNGFIILSSFSVLVVYAQELLPGKIGTVSGLIIGLAFGMGAVGAAALGRLIDLWGLSTIIHWTSFLPLFGLVAMLLPSDGKLREWSGEEQ